MVQPDFTSLKIACSYFTHKLSIGFTNSWCNPIQNFDMILADNIKLAKQSTAKSYNVGYSLKTTFPNNFALSFPEKTSTSKTRTGSRQCCIIHLDNPSTVMFMPLLSTSTIPAYDPWRVQYIQTLLLQIGGLAMKTLLAGRNNLP